MIVKTQIARIEIQPRISSVLSNVVSCIFNFGLSPIVSVFIRCRFLALAITYIYAPLFQIPEQ